LKCMDPAALGNTAPVESSQLPIGKMENQQATLPSVTSVISVTTPWQSSPVPISHEYEKDGDRMQCWVCGYWYHI
jgi:hypothetical protein